MDGVALASVITSGMAVIATSGVAVWTARQSANLARETRVHQRLAESYLEVVRIVEREGQWVDATITNREIAAEEAKSGYRLAERVKVPEPEPLVTDRAVIAAHLAAFGSDNVRRLYSTWRGTIDDIELETAVLKSYPEDGPTISRPGFARGNELRARQALADAIAAELGHRPAGGPDTANYNWRDGESQIWPR